VKRWLLLPVLFICAVGWTGLMSVDFGRRQATPASGGSTTTITYFDYDKTAFTDVTVYLSVLDGSEEPVAGLPESAFSIVEDDVPVDITDFIGGGAQPVTAVMLIDHSGSMSSNTKMQDAIDAALTFLDHLQDGRDRLGVIAFDDQSTTLGRLRLLDDTIRSDLQGRIRRLNAEGGTAYYDAVHQAVDLLSGTAGRKVVLALTDGIDEHSSRTVSSAIEQAQDDNVVLYTIGLGENVERRVLRRMSQETGGQYHEEPSSSDLADLYAELAQSLQDEYSLTYNSPTPRLDGTTRQVEVTVELEMATATAAGNYAVGGTLTPSLNLWPCLGTFPLLAMLVLPGLYDRVRGRGRLAEPEPVPAPSFAPPPPVPAPPVSPRIKTEVMSEPPPVPVPVPPAAHTPTPPAAPVCLSCGASLRPGARFCPACGQPAPTASPPSLTGKGAGGLGPAPACVHCSAPIRPGAKFCRACGQPVTAAPLSLTCPNCNAPLQPGVQFCAKCGQRV